MRLYVTSSSSSSSNSSSSRGGGGGGKRTTTIWLGPEVSLLLSVSGSGSVSVSVCHIINPSSRVALRKEQIHEFDASRINFAWTFGTYSTSGQTTAFAHAM